MVNLYRVFWVQAGARLEKYVVAADEDDLRDYISDLLLNNNARFQLFAEMPDAGP